MESQKKNKQRDFNQITDPTKFLHALQPQNQNSKQLEQKIKQKTEKYKNETKDSIIDAYYMRPQNLTFRKYQDLSLAITTQERGWENPIIENITMTVCIQNDKKQVLNFDKKDLHEMFIDEKKQKSDFIRILIKYNLQAHETLKEYYLPYDKIKNYVQGSAKDFFMVRVRFFKLDLEYIESVANHIFEGLAHTNIDEPEVKYELMDATEEHSWPSYSSFSLMKLYLDKSELRDKNQLYLCDIKDEEFNEDCFVCLKQTSVCQIFRSFISENSKYILSTEERTKILHKILIDKVYDAIDLSFECRLQLWLHTTSTNAMIQSNPRLVEKLIQMKSFANISFTQIELDVPRLATLEHSQKNEAADKQVRVLLSNLLYNYTKRNSISNFLQSQGYIASIICQVVYYGGYEYNNPDEIAFWLYSSVFEEILPVGFYSLSIEPLLLGALFNELFQVIDPYSYSILREIPSTVFCKYFISLFTEMKRTNIGMALLDLIMLIGSGSTTSTILHPQPVPVNEFERPLCRTVQLMLSIGLAMLRIILYKIKLQAVTGKRQAEQLGQMSIIQLEFLIYQDVTDQRKLIMEALQLEAFLFYPKQKSQEAQRTSSYFTLRDYTVQKQKSNIFGPFSDWGIQLDTIHPEFDLVDLVRDQRQQIILKQASFQPKVNQIISQRKNKTIINKTNFLKKFNFYSILKMSEYAKFRDDVIMPKDILLSFEQSVSKETSQSELLDECAFEKFVVENINCKDDYDTVKKYIPESPLPTANKPKLKSHHTACVLDPITSIDDLRSGSIVFNESDEIYYEESINFRQNLGKQIEEESKIIEDKQFPIIRTHHLCQSYQFSSEFKKLFKEEGPKQFQNEQSLNILFKNNVIWDKEICSQAVTDLRLVEFMYSIAGYPLTLTHIKNKKHFEMRLEQLEDELQSCKQIQKKQIKKTATQQEFDNMIEKSSQHDLYPYIYNYNFTLKNDKQVKTIQQRIAEETECKTNLINELQQKIAFINELPFNHKLIITKISNEETKDISFNHKK